MDISVNPAGGDEGGRLRIGSMPELQEKYATQNLAQGYSEADPFTRERYVQFHRFMPKHARSILDVGAGTGRGGQELAKLEPD